MNTPIISKFSEKPKTREAWRAMWLGLSTLFVGPLLGINAAVVRPMIDRAAGEKVGIAVGSVVALLVLALVVYAFVVCVRMLRKGERSWVLWVGFVPSAMSVAFLVLMVVGEFVFPH